MIQSIELKKGKEINLYRKHPWVFSGALTGMIDSLKDGDLVYVTDYKKNRLGFGHFHKGSIAIKMLGFGESDYSEGFWQERIKNAIATRSILNLERNSTNCYRIVHGEGDLLPGLVIDKYDNTIVIQCHSIGMHRQIETIAEAVQSSLRMDNLSIVDKSKESLPPQYALTIQNRVLFGTLGDLIGLEYGNQFLIDVLAGQKTGFFLDQRENRKLITAYAYKKNILNAYCYNGGFSIYALAAGAEKVCSVDVSKKALAALDQNLNLNKLDVNKHESFCMDVHQYLDQMEENLYDLIILDPPAFAKSISKRHVAIQAYKRINIQALKKIKKSALLFTFSCSQVISEEIFYNTIVSAGIESGRTIRVLHKMSQGPDHPVNLFHPEGAYLKGLVLYVD